MSGTNSFAIMRARDAQQCPGACRSDFDSLRGVIDERGCRLSAAARRCACPFADQGVIACCQDGSSAKFRNSL